MAMVLINFAPQTWAVPFMHEVNKIPPHRRNQMALDVFDLAFDAAFKLKADISSLIVVMSVFNQDKYNKICKHFSEYKDFSPYFEQMFGQLVKYLDESVCNFSDRDLISPSNEDENEERWRHEAFRWLTIGYVLMPGNQQICKIILQYLPQIEKKVNQSVLEYLRDRIISSLENGKLVEDAYHLFPYEYRETLLAKAVAVGYSYRVELWCFPYTGISDALAERAINKLIAKGHFPVERIQELSEDLQKKAFAEMEATAQIAMLRDYDAAKSYFSDETSLRAFQPKAELFLFTMESYHGAKHVYIKHFKMSDWTFLGLIHSLGVSYGENLVIAHATRWGLSEEQYMALLQTPFSGVAPFVKQYVGTAGKAELKSEVETEEPVSFQPEDEDSQEAKEQ